MKDHEGKIRKGITGFYRQSGFFGYLGGYTR